MALKCGICKSKLLSHSRKTKCSFCRSFYHLRCLPVDLMSEMNNTFLADWICQQCTRSEFPLNHFDDDEDFMSAIHEFQNNDSNITIDNLENMIFDPFEWNDANLDDPLCDSDPDLQFYNDIAGIQNTKKCDYYLEHSLRKKIDELGITDDCFSLFHLNVRSVAKNLTALQNYLECLRFKFMIIGVTETWLNNANVDVYSIDGYQHISACRENRRGGGLSMFVKWGLTVKVRHELQIMTDFVEAIFIELKKEQTGLNKDAVIGLVYRPPNKDLSLFINAMLAKLISLKDENKHVYLMGDFNADLLKCDGHILTSQLLDMFYANALIPLISKPTRITNKSATLIDNIYSNDLMNANVINGILFTKISDHLPIFCISYKAKTQETDCHLKRRSYTSKNIEHFANKLSSVDWNPIMQDFSGYDTFCKFYDQFRSMYEEAFPLVSSSFNYKNKKHWLTSGLKRSIAMKNSLYIKQLRNPSDENTKLYKRYKNKLTKVMKRAERLHFSELIEKHKGNSKKIWSVIKNVINKKTMKSVPSQLLINGKIETNRETMANKFNNYFTNIGKDLANKIPDSGVDPLSYLANNNDHSIFLRPVKSDEVEKIILSLKPSSPGYDGIHSDVIKKTYTHYLPTLVHLLNLSLSKGFFPDSMKIAKVVPIYKSGDPMSIGNYRPVSVLPLFSKIFERVMHSRMISYIDRFDLLYRYQFGFRKGHSSNLAVSILTDKILAALDNGETVIGVFLDFKKAFDTVDHDILLYKLDRYGFRGGALEWLRDYLKNRQQFVSLDDTGSKYMSVNCGVPQGSILGPLLFLLYINDIVNVSNLLIPLLYADDTNIFMTGTNLLDTTRKMNTELSKIVVWLKANKLSLNANKTHYMLFTGRRKVSGTVENILVDGHVIERVKNTKFVGVIIDEKFKWDHHIQYVRNKISKGIGILCKARQSFKLPTLQTLYYSLIYPYITYCVESWGNAAQIYIEPLILLQKKNCKNNDIIPIWYKL